MIEKGFVVNGLILCFREIKAQHLFEQETSQLNFPQYQDGSFMSNFKLGLFDYISLIADRGECHLQAYGLWADLLSPDLLKRTMVGTLTMFFQQWSTFDSPPCIYR